MSEPDVTCITGTCGVCDHVESMNVPTERLRQFREGGVFASLAFVGVMNANERELYLLSGLCPRCYLLELGSRNVKS